MSPINTPQRELTMVHVALAAPHHSSVEAPRPCTQNASTSKPKSGRGKIRPHEPLSLEPSLAKIVRTAQLQCAGRGVLY